MTDEEKIPRYILDLENVKFQDVDVDMLRREFVAVFKSSFAQRAAVWSGVKLLKNKIEKECDDPIFSSMEWTRLVKNLLDKVDLYELLKEDESKRLFEYVLTMTKKLTEIENVNDDLEEIVGIGEIRARADKILKDKGELPLRITAGRESVEGNLRIEFGKDNIELINEVINSIEAGKNG